MSELPDGVIVHRQLDLADLAEVLRTTEAALRMRLHRSPQTIPPFYRVGRAFRWNPATVQDWIERQTKTTSAAIAENLPSTRTGQSVRHRRSRRMRELARA
jgi:hypothetical protein